jgi:hypothetical protein
LENYSKYLFIATKNHKKLKTLLLILSFLCFFVAKIFSVSWLPQLFPELLNQTITQPAQRRDF